MLVGRIVTARDVRYGRRGGGWAETREGATCLTCRNADARWIAHLEDTGSWWPVCGSCRAQAVRVSADVTHQPLEIELSEMWR